MSEGRSGADPTAAPKHYWLTCLGSGPCLGALRYVCFVGLTDRGQFCFLVWFWSVRELASARDCARWVPLPPVRVCPRTPSKLLEPWTKHLRLENYLAQDSSQVFLWYSKHFREKITAQWARFPGRRESWSTCSHRRNSRLRRTVKIGSPNFVTVSRLRY